MRNGSFWVERLALKKLKSKSSGLEKEKYATNACCRRLGMGQYIMFRTRIQYFLLAIHIRVQNSIFCNIWFWPNMAHATIFQAAMGCSTVPNFQKPSVRDLIVQRRTLWTKKTQVGVLPPVCPESACIAKWCCVLEGVLQ